MDGDAHTPVLSGSRSLILYRTKQTWPVSSILLPHGDGHIRIHPADIALCKRSKESLVRISLVFGDLCWGQYTSSEIGPSPILGYESWSIMQSSLSISVDWLNCKHIKQFLEVSRRVHLKTEHKEGCGHSLPLQAKARDIAPF